MSQKKLYQSFRDIEAKGRVLGNYWSSFYEEISKHLPESYQSEMQQLSDGLGSAITHLIDELSNPTLTLATTGTTSSGKSTLVNFLCGAEIVPVATAEMSAGVVTIEYSASKSLVISETPGATWECGEWHEIGDKEIYQRLYNMMISFLDNRKSDKDIAYPISLIRYPFRILEDLKLELPHGTKVRLLDLPGLAHVGDENNAEVIRQCREALCLVTYNSSEIDNKKVKNLLQEVAQQVKELGGSPARMLFILNRIDVFRADRSWPSSEDRFVKQTTQSIKSELVEQLKEYTSEIEKLSTIKLSSWPALLSLQVNPHSDEIENINIGAAREADEHFNFLIKEVVEDLPRNPGNWKKHDFKRVAKCLRDKSYAQEFEHVLQNHITNHFPQLVIPQIIERFNVNAGNAVVEWALQTTNAILNCSRENYEQECAHITEIRSSLEHFLEISDSKLREPFEKVDAKFQQVFSNESDEDPVQYLKEIIRSELQEVDPYNSLDEKLYPIYGWSEDIGKGINKVLELIAESLVEGVINLDDPNFQKVEDPSKIDLLERHLRRLINLGYTGNLANEGETREARTNEEKEKLHQLNDALNELAIHISMVMKDILKQICKQASNRIFESVNDLFSFHLSYLEEGADKIAPDMGIRFPDSQLIKLEKQPVFNITFKAGFTIEQGEWEESVEVSYRERVWWKLWIWKGTKKKTEVQLRTSDNANIPGVKHLLVGWVGQARDTEKEIVSQILSWLLEQVHILKKNINDVQTDVIDRYQARLDRANQELTIDYEKQKNIWDPIHRKAENLKQEFSDLKL